MKRSEAYEAGRFSFWDDTNPYPESTQEHSDWLLGREDRNEAKWESQYGYGAV